MPKLPKKKSWFIKDEIKALKLLKKLFHIKLVKIALILLIVITLGPLTMFFFLKPKAQTDITNGVTFSKKYTEELGMDWRSSYLKILDDLGVDNLRLVAYWDDVEKYKDNYNFEDIKWQLEEAEKRNVNVIMNIGRKVPRYPECFEPSWWNEIESEELRNVELYEYIKVAVTELKQFENIQKWQVENEPFFPFGECLYEIKFSTVRQEVEIVRSVDDRPILIQDSGEGGLWYPSFTLGDYLAISMYRKIWYDFWGALGGDFIYFKYPLAHWTYKIKADVTRVPYQRIVVTELQAEPWGPSINSELSQYEKDRSFSRNDFLATTSYAQQAGFKDLYFWGVEWWLWEKEFNNNPFFWDSARALFN